MKRIKQALSLVLAMVMMLSLGAAPVEAAGRGQQGWSSVTYGASEESAALPETPAYPAVTLAGATESGTSVRVEAPEGALPEGTSMTLADVSADEVQAKVSGEIAGRILAAVDITFRDIAGNEIQPDGNVSVFIKAPELTEAAAEELGIIHIDEENRVAEELTRAENAVEVNAANENEVSFQNDAFSVYAVIEEGETGDKARLTVNFWNLSNSTTDPVATVYIKQEDLADTPNGKTAAEKLDEILYDPGVGTLVDGQIFRGWSVSASRDSEDGKNYTIEEVESEDSTKAKTIGQIRDDFLASDFEAIEEGQVLNIYAIILKYYMVEYHEVDSDNNLDRTLYIDSLLMLDSEQSVPYTITMNYTPASDTGNVNFDGWYASTGNSNISNPSQTVTVGNHTVYPVGTTMTVSGNVVFSTQSSQGYWLTFNRNGDNATYIAPEFIRSGATPTPPADPTRIGYEFDAWYTAAEGGTEYQFDTPLTDNLEIFAHWTPNPTADYTVNIWQQRVTDTITTNPKNYDLVYSTKVSDASTTDPITNSDLSGDLIWINGNGEQVTVSKDFTDLVQEYSTSKYVFNGTETDFWGFELSTDNSVTGLGDVNPNGTTVVNIYYDRVKVTYKFYTPYGSFDVKAIPASSINEIVEGYYYASANDARNNGSTRYFINRRIWSISGVIPISVLAVPYFSDSDNPIAFGIPLTNRVWARGRTGYLYWWPQSNVYERDYGNNWELFDTIEGLYGTEMLDEPWPKTANGENRRWMFSKDYTERYFTSLETVFHSVNRTDGMPFEDAFYGREVTYDTQVRHYLEDVDGNPQSSPQYQIGTTDYAVMAFRNIAGYEPDKYDVALPSGAHDIKFVTDVQYVESGTGASAQGDYVCTYGENATPTADGWVVDIPYGTGLSYKVGSGNSEYEYRPSTNKYQVAANSNAQGIKMYYKPRPYTISYTIGKFTNGNNATLPTDPTVELPVPVNPVKYGEAITAEDHLPTMDPSGEFVFDGWYFDAGCTQKADLTTFPKMPARNVTLYGRWVEKEYRVFLDPNLEVSDGVYDHAVWGGDPAVPLSTSFRVGYDQKVSLSVGSSRNGYNFNGWYDKATGELFDPDTPLTDDVTYAPYDKDTVSTERDEYGRVTSQVNADTDRPWIKRMLELIAMWVPVYNDTTGIVINYDRDGYILEDDNTTAPVTAASVPTSDKREYMDGATAIAQAAAGSPNANYQFAYWVLRTYDENEGAYVDKEDPNDPELYHYYPGKTFEVLESDAHAVTGTDGVTHMTVMLRPVFVQKSEETQTYINWYKNYGSDEDPLYTTAPIKINDRVDISSNQVPTRPGYIFLGWAREREFEDDTNSVVVPLYENLDEDDLFLKYDSENDKYQTPKGSGWVDVTYIAADEVMPYHALYAVWEKIPSFYVFRSRTAKLAAYPLKDNNGNKVTYPFSEVGTGLLYGGTFKSYGAYTPTSTDLKNAIDRFGSLADTAAAPYDGSAIKSGLKMYWQSKNTMGAEEELVEDAIYYVKEVPDGYLDNAIRFVYDQETGKVSKLFLFTATDDTSYKSVGFTVSTLDEPLPAALCTSFAFQEKKSGTSLQLKVGSQDKGGTVFTSLPRGYLGYCDASDLLVANQTYTIQPRWVTWDDVPVLGKAITLTTGDCTNGENGIHQINND